MPHPIRKSSVPIGPPCCYGTTTLSTESHHCTVEQACALELRDQHNLQRLAASAPEGRATVTAPGAKCSAETSLGGEVCAAFRLSLLLAGAKIPCKISANVQTVFLGRLGPQYLAAVELATQVTFIGNEIILGLNAPLSCLTSQAIGAGNTQPYTTVIHTAVFGFCWCTRKKGVVLRQPA